MIKQLSNRLEAWAERVRLRKLDHLMFTMSNSTTIREYCLAREQLNRELETKYAKGVA